MLSPQPSKMNLLLKPSSISRLPKSGNNSPRLLSSFEISHSESANSTQSSLNKSTCVLLLKNLKELSQNLDAIVRRSKSSDKEFSDLFQNCKKSLKFVKDKLEELNAEEDPKSSDSKSLQDTPQMIRPDVNEYCLFLEHLVVYEQRNAELIMQKSKFPKVRMKEVDKILSDEFSIKGNSNLPAIKQGEGGLLERFKKESKDLTRKTKKLLNENAKIPKDVQELLENSCADEEFFSISSLESQSFIDSRSYFEESKYLIDGKKKFQVMYEQLNEEHKILTHKYSCLIAKFNKQDKELKFRSKALLLLSMDLADLKHEFYNFVDEINGYLRKLIQKFEVTGESICKYKEDKRRCDWNTQKESLEKEVFELKGKVSELENRFSKSQEELNSLKEDSEDSLDLCSNINDIIEIQKLKEEIRLLNFKNYESSNSFQKDLSSYKSQVSKLRSHNFSLEERIKSLNRRITEVLQEKEKLLNEIPMTNRNTLIPEILSISENSLEKSEKVTGSDILAILTDDIEDIASQLKSHNLFVQYHDSNINLLRKACEFLIGLKEDMVEESGCFEMMLEKLVEERMNGDDFGRFERDMGTECFLKDREVEIYKIKLKDKKAQIELMRQQNDILKKTVKDLQAKVAKGFSQS